MRDRIVDLELYAIKNHYGIYLKCDSCGATLDAPVVSDRISADESELRDLARSLGWSGAMSRQSSNDLCPECNKGNV